MQMSSRQHGAAAPAASNTSPHVVVIYADAGGGHRATAQAIRGVLENSGTCRVTLYNPYTGVLARLDPFTKTVGRSVEAIYNDLVLGDGRTGLFCWAFFLVSVISVKFLRRAGARAFTSLWDELKPDLVLSVIPVLNDAMMDSMKRWCGGSVPFAIMMTDWAEVSPYVWFPRGEDYAAISGTEDGQRRLATKRHPVDKTYGMGGLLIRPEFYQPLPKDIGAAREAMGLAPDKPTVVITYGGHGGPRLLELAHALADVRTELQVIFICGRNARLFQDLHDARLPYRDLVLDFRPDVHRFLAVADVFVGKAGPQSVSEALALGLALLIDARRVLPQEKALTKWVVDQGAGTTFIHLEEFVRKLEGLTSALRSREARTAARRNTAADDIVRIVESLLGASAAVGTGEDGSGT